MGSHKKKWGSCRKKREGTLHGPKNSTVPFNRVREVDNNVWATGPNLFPREAEASVRQENGSKLKRRRFPGRSPAPVDIGSCSQFGSTLIQPSRQN